MLRYFSQAGGNMAGEAKKRRAYGNGTTYQKADKTWIAQKTVEFEGYGKKKISGSGDTETKAIRKRNENVKAFREKIAKERYEAEHKDEIETQKREEEARKKGTLGSHILEWFKRHVKPNCALTTYDKYMEEYNYYIKPYSIADMDITEIAEEHLMDYYRELFLHGKKRTGGGLNYKTVNKARAHIRAAFQRSFKAGEIRKDPHDEIHQFNESSYSKFNPEAIIKASEEGVIITQMKTKVHPMTEQEANLFLQSAKDTRLFTLFVIALTTACRRGELLGLKWENVHVDKGYIIIDKSLAYVEKENKKPGEPAKLAILKETKSKSSRRVVPLNRVAVCALEITRRDQEYDKQVYGSDYRDKGLVFCDQFGDYYTEGKVRYWFQKCIVQAGITRHTLHDCRHTVCSFLIKREAQPKLIQALLGHSLLSTTMDIYGDMFLDVESQFISQLDDVYEIKGEDAAFYEIQDEACMAGNAIEKSNGHREE